MPGEWELKPIQKENAMRPASCYSAAMKEVRKLPGRYPERKMLPLCWPTNGRTFTNLYSFKNIGLHSFFQIVNTSQSAFLSHKRATGSDLA